MLLAPAPLAAGHVLNLFDSGVPALDDWLRRRAASNQSAGASRTYVVSGDDMRVVGYYAIASGALSILEAPSRIKRNMPDPIPMAILGRLAVDRTAQGQGLGRAMLQDCVLRVRQAANIMGIRGLLVHAISDDAQRFYERHGFTPSPTNPATLILSIA